MTRSSQTGGAMKKQLLIAIFTTILITNSVNAQYRSTTFLRASQVDNNLRQELKELRDFEHQLDQFSYLIMVGDSWQAQKSKVTILHLMENEIIQTERKINLLLREDRFNKKTFRRKSDRNNVNVYSKRNGYDYEYSTEVNRLIRQLENKERLMYSFEDTDLNGRRRQIVNKTEHRRIMYEFRDMMKQEIERARMDNQRNGRERRG